ncbi:hypothetical protein CBF37_10285 [Vagococcus vulneris]|uniref:Uncharacterized protein n=1 Tax=Vagococcus vulneris TaxID=1977869 RepID=A0A429ZU42_9ENTE|nr:hypothetical protein CBF37_10285 [Vagococcus vulneris]
MIDISWSGNQIYLIILGDFFYTTLKALLNHPHSRWFSKHIKIDADEFLHPHQKLHCHFN